MGGDTLVVDVNNFKEGNWLAAGIVSSDKLHITERYTRIDKDQLNYEAVIEDRSCSPSRGPFAARSCCARASASASRLCGKQPRSRPLSGVP